MPHTGDRYIVTIDGREFDVTVTLDAEGYLLEHRGRKRRVAVRQISFKKFLLKIDAASWEVDISRNGDNLDVFLEGKQLGVKVEPYDLAELRKRAGIAAGGPEEKTIRAPMPGLVLSTEVKMGDRIEKEKTLVIIEAMKMENMIRAPFPGTVKEVFVSPGQAVEKNDKLLELE
ncbi:MAG: hypothetical protein JSV44_06195 [Candidatus Zixiibacteriota bacterium]|nr:MAG: hypothetical protein JSV44_06195 [candidate division Zixibacteria bacterium]